MTRQKDSIYRETCSVKPLPEIPHLARSSRETVDEKAPVAVSTKVEPVQIQGRRFYGRDHLGLIYDAGTPSTVCCVIFIANFRFAFLLFSDRGLTREHRQDVLARDPVEILSFEEDTNFFQLQVWMIEGEFRAEDELACAESPQCLLNDQVRAH